MKWFNDHILNSIAGLLTAALGYFSPIQGVVKVMVVAVLFDLVVGLWASLKKGIGIKEDKLWQTMIKLFLSVSVVAMLYAIDHEVGKEIVELHRIVAWFVCGFEAWSIIKHSGEISNHKLFRMLSKYMEDRIQDKTGIKIKDYDQKSDS